MLLHNLYINVSIANILVYSKSLYDLPKPIEKNRKGAYREKRAWPETPSFHLVQKWREGKMF